jgi:hypothetical protein
MERCIFCYQPNLRKTKNNITKVLKFSSKVIKMSNYELTANDSFCLVIESCFVFFYLKSNGTFI